jgi:hypothetical protein
MELQNLRQNIHQEQFTKTIHKPAGRRWLLEIMTLVALLFPVFTWAQTLNTSALTLTPRTFQSFPGSQTVYVLGIDGKLWAEQAPFGHLPPNRPPTPIDANVWTFQAIDPQNMLVLGTDGNLWLEPQPPGRVPRQQVDGSVSAFQALDTQNVFVLGNDGALWLEPAPFNKVPNPNRQQIDGNVKAFQVLDTQDVLVLGNDGNLWLEQAPFGSVPPPHRTRIDGNVWTFQQGSLGNIFVLGMDGNLWLEQPPFGSGIPHRQQVDGNVRAFQAIPVLNWAWVLGNDGNLWLEQGPFGKVPPTRQQVDANVRAFQGLDIQHALVLGTDTNLWLEQAPFGQVPPQRQIVDTNVQPFPVPGGPYRQSCTVLNNIAGALTAACPDYFGTNVPTMPLINSNACVGAIQNINGALRCVVSKTVVTDSITETISHISSSDSNWIYNIWTIDEPNVVNSPNSYPQIAYRPGDTLKVTAGGCVQTGGIGLTWKSYTQPLNSDGTASNQYFGQITLPASGVQSLQSIGGVINKEWPVDANLPPTIPLSDLHLTLGYKDDNYGDNGYYKHDNGNVDQCLNVGPAWVSVMAMTPRSPSQSTGPVYSPGSKPFDLVWDVNNIDGNGLPFNPMWFPQSQEIKAGKTLTTNDFGSICGQAFTTTTNPWGGYDFKEDAGVLAGDCTSQSPTTDVVGWNLFAAPVINTGYCKEQFAPMPGHLNWGIATYDGDIFFSNWSGKFPEDEDYNFALHHVDQSGLENSLPNEEPTNEPSFLLEFKSYESIDGYFQSPWWVGFRNAVENQSQPANIALDYAIVTGEFGIDGAHKSGYSELHPVYSMAIRTASVPDGQGGVDETWEFFIRSQGTEGSCSQEIHNWESVGGGSDWPNHGPYYIQLPWPAGAISVNKPSITAYPWENGDTVGPAQYMQGRWTYLQFNLTIDPAFPGRASGFDGQIQLHYTLQPGASAQAQVQAQRSKHQPEISSPASDIDAINWPAVLQSLSDTAVKTHVEKFLATPPSSLTPPRNNPIITSLQLTPYVRKPSPGSQGILTRSRMTVDPITAKGIVDLEAAMGFPPTTFQASPGSPNIFVLGIDHNLWLEQPPFGKVPPARQQVDGNVETFQALDDQDVLVLGTDGNLWLEHGPFGKVPPARQQVDGNVLAFQALSTEEIFVLGADRKLWLEQSPFGKVPPTRVQVDANVRNFQGLDTDRVLVVGTDDNLWLERSPFGNVPPNRRQVDNNVWAFSQPGAQGPIFVLAADGNLWLERPPFGTVPPATRRQVDGNVQSFHTLGNIDTVWVLGTDGNLWLEQRPYGKIPPARQQVDGNVWAFQPIDANHVLVLGRDGNLWLEQGPFGRVPPSRQQVDANVR